MRGIRDRRKFPGRPLGAVLAGLALAVSLAAGPAQARTWRAEVAAIAYGGVRADDLRVSLDWPADAAEGALRLSLRRLDAGEFGYRFGDLDWTCPLRRDESATWRCEGTLRYRGGERQLAIALSPESAGAELRSGRSRLAVERRDATPDEIAVILQRLPATWLQGAVATLWADGRVQGGRIDGRIALRTGRPESLVASGNVDVAALDLDTPDGTIATAGLGAALKIGYRQDPGGSGFSLEGELRGGELLAGPLYVPLPGSPVAIALDGEQAASGWRFPRWSWRDGAALRASGAAAIDGDLSLRDLDLALDSGDMATARERYLASWLGLHALGDLQFNGALEASLRFAGGEAQRVELRPRQIAVIDPNGRFSFAGLDGEVVWHAGPQTESGTLRWSAGALFGIGLGAVTLPLGSDGRELRLAAPVAMDVLGGRLRLERFGFSPPANGDGARAQLGMVLDDLDLALLSQRLGWPAFTGTLGGRLPSARYERNRLDFEGGLTMRLFDGRVSIASMAMERPFGVAPTLSANVEFAGLDLQPLTAAFGFGEITGRLQGHIRNLRLIDWEPVAFDASLRTDPDYRGRQRISQRAVQDISNIGGGGLAAGVQNQLLKLFSSFGYTRIGLSCVLADDVCRMDGLDSAGRGYTIVEGAGLPHISVVGFQRRVDWPVLVDRLKAATEGQRPVID